MFDHLSGLCRDASWLKSYMASDLVFLKELMQVGITGLAMANWPVQEAGTFFHREGDAGAGAEV